MKTELLAPAGSMEALKAAVSAGADAVYLGGAAFGARAYAKNLDEQEILSAIDYVHLRNRKLYLTVNTLLKEEELEEKLYPYLRPYYEQGLDAVIVQDMGVLKAVRSWFPDLDIHASTQMTVTGSAGARFLESLGATRVVPARELSFAEIQKIHRTTNLEIECFVHGALCYCYSGQCLFSSLIGGRSGNRGRCAQPCRLPYQVRTPEAHHYKTQKDFCPLSLKDMCTLDLLPEIISAGVTSLKIEGRNKTEYYAAITARSYRQAIDDYRRDPKNWSPDRYMDELYTLQNRGYCLGFYDGHLTNLSQNYEYTRTLGDWLFAGSIVEWQGDDIIFEVRNYINGGEFIEFLVPGSLENVRLALNEFEDADSGEITPRVSAGQGKKIRIPAAAFGRPAEIVREKLPQYTVARKPAVLQTDAREMLDRKKEEFAALCRQD